MKVLQVIDSLATGGAEKLLLDSVPLYREAGVEMDVLVLKDENYAFMQQLEQQQICKIYKLGSGTVYHPKHIFKIAKIIGNYDIAHVHLFPAQYWVVLAKKWSRLETKLIFTEHSTSNRRIRSVYSKPIEKWVYRNYAKIIVIASEVLKALQEHISLDTSQMHLIHNGVNIETFKKAEPLDRKKFHFTKNDFIAIQVSSFKYPKDQQTVIRALKNTRKNVKLILVGDGPQKKLCEDLVKELELEDRVQFLGNRNNVPQLLKTADVVILSSHYEGMSLSSIEGMASGRPFVASNVPGLKDIVQDAGVLFPEGDAEALSKIIIRLEEDEAYTKKTVAQCQKRAKQYAIESMVNQYIALYEEVLA